MFAGLPPPPTGPVLRKEEGSCKPSKQGKRARHSLLWGVHLTAGSRWAELAAFLRPVWTAWSHAFPSPGQNWGALFTLHLPPKQSHWFLLPETLNKCHYFTGFAAPFITRKEGSSFLCLCDGTFSLFSSVFIFVRDFRDQKPTHSLWFWICKKWHNIVFHYFFKRWCVMSLLLSTDS